MSDRYRYIVTIKELDRFGLVSRTYPGIFIAHSVQELLVNVRKSVGATYDNFMQAWSHEFTIDRIEQHEEPIAPVTVVNNYINKEENDVLGRPAADGD